MEHLHGDESALRKECERVFHDSDSQDKGYLSQEDYKVAVLSIFGYKPSKYELATVWGGVTSASSGMDKPTFVGLMLQRLQQQDQDELIRQIFVAFDVQSQGFLTLENAKKAFKEVVPRLDGELVAGCFRELDGNCDGRVSYRDFELMMKHFQIVPFNK